MSSALPKTERGRQTRSRILAAAGELIDNSGVDATSIDQVTQHAEVSKSQFYHYFKDRTELVEDLTILRADEILDRQSIQLVAIDDWRSLISWVDGLVDQQVATACTYRCPIGSLTQTAAIRDEQVRAGVATVFDRWLDALEGTFARLIAGGVLTPKTNARELAMSLLACFQGGLVLSTAMRDPAPLRASLQSAIAFIEQRRAA